jgi:hypothetical protein
VRRLLLFPALKGGDYTPPVAPDFTWSPPAYLLKVNTMTQTTLTITSADVDRRFGPANGYVNRLAMKQGPLGPPLVTDWDPGWGKFGRAKTNFLTLRGTGDFKPIYNINIATDPIGLAIAYTSVPYRGELEIVACPKGATFELVVSDIPVASTSTDAAELPSITVGAARRA